MMSTTNKVGYMTSLTGSMGNTSCTYGSYQHIMCRDVVSMWIQVSFGEQEHDTRIFLKEIIILCQNREPFTITQ